MSPWIDLSVYLLTIHSFQELVAPIGIVTPCLCTGYDYWKDEDGNPLGYAGGMSRIGVVGDIIPVALAFLGGVSVYLFGVNRAAGVIASVGGIAFTLALLTGYETGADKRTSISARGDIDRICVGMLADKEVLASDMFCLIQDTFGQACPEALIRQQKKVHTEDAKDLDRDEIAGRLHQFYKTNCRAWRAGKKLSDAAPDTQNARGPAEAR